MPLQARAHHTPTKPWSVRHGDISIFDAEDALLNQGENFTVQSRLQPVPHVARHRLAQPDRLLSDRCVEGNSSFDYSLRGLRPADYFHQRNYVRRIKRMA